jgi:hypothetical protein
MRIEPYGPHGRSMCGCRELDLAAELARRDSERSSSYLRKSLRPAGTTAGSDATVAPALDHLLPGSWVGVSNKPTTDMVPELSGYDFRHPNARVHSVSRRVPHAVPYAEPVTSTNAGSVERSRSNT